jgi:hypothetical protein
VVSSSPAPVLKADVTTATVVNPTAPISIMYNR